MSAAFDDVFSCNVDRGDEITLALAGGDPAFMLHVERALEGMAGFDVVGWTCSGRRVLRLLERAEPDVLVLETELAGIDGLTCLAAVREQHPNVSVVVCSATDDPDQVCEALDGGASAFIARVDHPADVAEALRVVSEIGVLDAATSASTSL